MTITNPVLVGDGLMPIAKSAPWAVNDHVSGVGAVGNEELRTAPGAGKASYLTHVTIGGIDGNLGFIDVAVTLVDGAGTNILGPIECQRNGDNFYQKDFDPPLKVTDNKALDATITGGGATYKAAVLIYVEGFTGQKPI
jgi:hypothetical protein